MLSSYTSTSSAVNPHSDLNGELIGFFLFLWLMFCFRFFGRLIHDNEKRGHNRHWTINLFKTCQLFE